MCLNTLEDCITGCYGMVCNFLQEFSDSTESDVKQDLSMAAALQQVSCVQTLYL